MGKLAAEAVVSKSNTPQQATGHGLACPFRPKGRGICTQRVLTLAAFAKYPRERGCLAKCPRGTLLAGIKYLQYIGSYGTILNCETIMNPCSWAKPGAGDQKEVQRA